ncbi:MAG: hypothetical protein QXN88_03450 [Sulfolobales archaeon]
MSKSADMSLSEFEKLYKEVIEAVPEPPEELKKLSIKSVVKYFGFGALIAAIGVGSGELIWTPRAGFGFHVGWYCLILTLGFIDLGAPFIGAHIIDLHPFRVTPTHSSPSFSSQLWGNPHILALSTHLLGSLPCTRIVDEFNPR